MDPDPRKRAGLPPATRHCRPALTAFSQHACSIEIDRDAPNGRPIHKRSLGRAAPDRASEASPRRCRGMLMPEGDASMDRRGIVDSPLATATVAVANGSRLPG